MKYLFQEQLLGYEPGRTASEFLVDGQELIFPVVADGQVASSVVVARYGDGWAIRRIGSPNLTRALADARAAHAEATGRADSDYFVVHVPDMYRMYIAYEDIGGVALHPVFLPNRRGTDVLAPGGTVTAEAVVGALAEEARDFVGALPRRRFSS